MKLLIGGDVVPSTTNEQFFIDGDSKTLFGDTINLAKNADRVLINLEFALTKSENGIKKFGPKLKGDPKCVNALKAFGVTDAMLANNHVFDFGEEGLRDTLATLEEAGISYNGVGENDIDSRKPYIIEKDGEKVGIINVAEHEYSYALPNRMGVNPFDSFLTMQDIREMKKLTDYVVVIYHGGKEFCQYPSPRLRNLCHEMVLCGADTVLCQHSHCIGCYEKYEDGHILYGQGNFCFTKENLPEIWYSGLLLELDTKKNLASFYAFTVQELGINLAKGEEKEKILNAFNLRNEELLNGKWKEGWHAFCESVKEKYIAVLRGLEMEETTESQTQRFAHYLDCEAHTDVWRELYPTWNQTNK